jgi:hypothetical protein
LAEVTVEPLVSNTLGTQAPDQTVSAVRMQPGMPMKPALQVAVPVCAKVSSRVWLAASGWCRLAP